MRKREEHGQVTLLIIGFAGILLMAIVAVIDASSAYLQRQGLDNLADGAALYGADLGSSGIYEEGLGQDRLSQQEAAVRAAVRDYLTRAGAARTYPGIDVGVRIDAANRSVTVRLEAPRDLPLTDPASPRSPREKIRIVVASTLTCGQFQPSPSSPRVAASSTAAVAVVAGD